MVAYLDDEAERLRLKGNPPGERWFHDHLREKGPGFALARQWAGLDQEAELLRRPGVRCTRLPSTPVLSDCPASASETAKTCSRSGLRQVPPRGFEPRFPP